jgi:integrase
VTTSDDKGDITQWGEHQLNEIRTMVETWLRGLSIARSTCAKIRNVMSVLNHACRYEFFDHNPIHLVRQSAKRKAVPVILKPAEIKTLLEGLNPREKTLVLIAASPGVRQSELFALKWGDIDFPAGTINIVRSIVALYKRRRLLFTASALLVSALSVTAQTPKTHRVASPPKDRKGGLSSSPTLLLGL